MKTGRCLAASKTFSQVRARHGKTLFAQRESAETAAIREWRRATGSFDSHSIAFTLQRLRGRFTIHAMLNACRESLTFEVPLAGAKTQWRRWIDTSLETPHDVRAWESARAAPAPKYTVATRPVAFLVDPAQLNQASRVLSKNPEARGCPFQIPRRFCTVL